MGFYSFSSLVNSEKKCIGSFLPDLTEAFIGWFHEHAFVMGAGGPAALNGCVNNRDGNQVAAMSGPTLDRVFDRGWLCAWSQNCVVVSFSDSQLVLYIL